MGKLTTICVLLATVFAVSLADDKSNSYKICVPKAIIKECKKFLEEPESSVATVTCVTGRDRMDCLDKVEKREADFLFVDPEDMYVAYHLNNQDFSVFTELRTIDEPQAEFRYEGIILVRKNSDIRTLQDLKGKKSCHTGYGRNVGFKIPISKLKKHDVLKVSKDVQLSPVEKELKALSEFFSKSCIVGKWSPNADVNTQLKKRYSNLCEMCEDPVKCDYPDKYSHYDGAIRCLVENNGDVAFTKTMFVKKYFGLPIGHGNTQTPAPATADPELYEYLCEDGTRRPLTGDKPCSWAQRPWQAYMGNGDVSRRLKKLQQRIQTFYTDGKTNADTAGALKMQINPKLTVVDKETPVLPGEHLVKAQYKDVIERDGSTSQKIKLCVTNNEEMKKCSTMKRAAYSRDIRPELECVLKSKDECVKAVKDGEADVVVVKPDDYQKAKDAQLKVALYEIYDHEDVYVAVALKNAGEASLKKATLKVDLSTRRSVDAGLNYNKKRQQKVCPAALDSNDNGDVKIVRAKDLSTFKADEFELVCQDFSRKPLDKFVDCNWDYTLPTGIFVRNSLTSYELDNISHAFTALSEKFGHGGKVEEVFEMFATYEEGQNDVIFDDDAAKLVTPDNYVLTVDENAYKELRCK